MLTGTSDKFLREYAIYEDTGTIVWALVGLDQTSHFARIH